jgi:enterochelin esterase-like enzyme
VAIIRTSYIDEIDRGLPFRVPCRSMMRPVHTLILAGALLAIPGTTAYAQAPEDCKPSVLNIPEAKYPCIYPDRRAMFRVIAPDAQKVSVRISGGFDMQKGPDGIWSVTTTPLVEGFHYYTLRIDGATVADPSTFTYFGSGWWNSGIEIPSTDGDFSAMKDVPHGKVSQQRYFSKVTNQWRRAFVYTPPGYDTNPRQTYPVLYLLHGWGEDETGWYRQGHVDAIMDNLIAAGKAKPMIIVMDNLNAVKPGESAAIFGARGQVPPPSATPPPPPAPPGAPPAGRGGPPAGGGRGGPLARPTFGEMMFADLVPFVERTYRVSPGKQNRAMAGLSMGGAQTFGTVLENLDKFAYMGGFSGSCGGFGRGGDALDVKTICGGAFADPAAFNNKIKVLFLGIGSVEGPGTKAFSDALTAAGIHNVYYESPGTAHEWLTWRRALREFTPLLFK